MADLFNDLGNRIDTSLGLNFLDTRRVNGQSFLTTSTDFALTGLSFKLYDPSAAPGVLTISLYTATGSGIGMLVTDLGTVQNAAIGTSTTSTVSINFTLQPLTINTQYYIVLSDTTANAVVWNYTNSTAGTGIIGTNYVVAGAPSQPSNAGGQWLMQAVTCYARGTRIRTTAGEIAIEALRPGDLAVLHDGGIAPVRWVGERDIDCTRYARPAEAWPVRVRRGAFAEGVPGRDLVLSPEHAVLIEGVLVPIRCLQNGTTVRQESVDRVHYYHVELDRHAVVLAEGLAAESYLECGRRGDFSNGGEPVTLHPSFAVDDAAGGCAPRASGGPVVQAERARLMARAVALGSVVRRDADLHLLVDGRRVMLGAEGASVPAGARDVRLVSCTGVPSEHDPASDDGRRLGVLLDGIMVAGPGGAVAVPLDAPMLGEGFSGVERSGARPIRWTTGAAVLPVALWGGSAVRVWVSVMAVHPSWVEPASEEPAWQEPAWAAPGGTAGVWRAA